MKYSSNKFLRASGIIFIGSLIANVLNYLFNVAMGWLIAPAVYGELVSLVTLLLIVSVPSGTITTVVAKYVSAHHSRGERSAMAALLRGMTTLSCALGALSYLVFALATPFIASYLHIDQTPIFIFGLLIPLSFLGGTTSGFLQGIQAFVPLAVIAAAGATLKLLISIGLIQAGFALDGIMVALVLASAATYGYGMYVSARAVRAAPDESEPAAASSWRAVLKDKTNYITVSFIATLFLAIFVNIDTILAKHYLPAIAAGEYSALSVLARVVSYGAGAIVTVLFPLVSASHAQGNDAKAEKYLGGTLAIVGGASLGLFLLFAFFPSFVISLLFGARYLAAAPFLVYFAGAIGFSTLSTIFVQFFLAVHEKTFVYPLAALTFAEVGGIAVFHADIHQIVLSSLATSVLLCLVLTGIYFAFRRNKQAPGALAPAVPNFS